MKPSSRRWLHWTPRLLGLAFAAFTSIFALDVFNEGLALWPTARALALHLIPTFLILATLCLAWRWEWVGAIVFTALAAGYLVFFWGRFHWSAYAVISGPLWVVGVLFLVDWVWGSRRPHSPTNTPG